EVWYPGWTARLDGAPAPLARANYLFQAVPVPAGQHTLELRYRPLSFYGGAALSLAGLALLWVVWKRTRRAHG
ncbi:MAG: YfhO family protein, partial [Anaerolineales bacterium]|nr:YfhO family protein [Anaerolineales bacterium]